MLKETKKKLKNKAGETIAETLVALLIAALALTMLAGAVTTSANIIKTSKETLEAYYDNEDAMALFVANERKDLKKGKAVIVMKGDTLGEKRYDVDFIENDRISKTPVVVYKKQVD